MSEPRPFHFIVVFWGDAFRDYLVDYCLPSLLSPGNIPSLTRGRHRFIFCTTAADWGALVRTPIFALLERHIEPLFVEIPPAPPGQSGCEHMGVGHKRAAEIVHREQGYGVFVTPDLMLSDGSVAALERRARAGSKVVLCAAIRFGEEPLFEHFRAAGVIPNGDRPLGRALTVTGRQMVAAMMGSFHSETARYGWESPAFTDFPAACWWRVPDEDGIVIHSLSWVPLLVDYGVVDEHDTSAFDTWTLDADYIYRNFGERDGVHIVTDSDEIMLVSWTPLADRPQSLAPNPLKRLPVLGDWVKGAILRGAMTSGVFDPLKQRIFFKPVRWHARGLTPAWERTEGRAARILDRYVGDLNGTEARAPLTIATLGALGRVWIVTADLVVHADRLAVRLGQVLRGDRAAAERLRRRVRIVWGMIRGAEARH